MHLEEYSSLFTSLNQMILSDCSIDATQQSFTVRILQGCVSSLVVVNVPSTCCQRFLLSQSAMVQRTGLEV